MAHIEDPFLCYFSFSDIEMLVCHNEYSGWLNILL
jgi:hypothetical protein